jgi:hypothetical protein
VIHALLVHNKCTTPRHIGSHPNVPWSSAFVVHWEYFDHLPNLYSPEREREREREGLDVTTMLNLKLTSSKAYGNSQLPYNYTNNK